MKKNVEQIRLENFFEIIAQNGSPSLVDIAKTIGGTNRTAMSAIKNGSRNISSKMARRIESAYSKSFGWLDDIHENERIDYEYDLIHETLNRIYNSADIVNLYDTSSIEGKAVLFDKIYMLLTDNEVRKLPLASLYKLLGVTLDEDSPTTSGKVTRKK